MSEYASIISNFVTTALAEDLQGDTDHTAWACIPSEKQAIAQIIAKESGIIAGIEDAIACIRLFDPQLMVSTNITDGASVDVGDQIMELKGSARNIVTIERTILNLMQRMSGIATLTRQYANAIAHTNASVLDTRKTTPGLRYFEKKAVKIGGGKNHRMGLFDMLLIKDNHIDAAGSIHKAVTAANSYLAEKELQIPIEVEVRNMDELNEVLETGHINRIMLDNFSVTDTQTAVKLINNLYTTETSGNISLETIAPYAECGVDYISVGKLTHSVKSLDLSLLISL